MPVLLVIDDERSIHLAFGRAFRAEGLEVLTAATAAEGLALAERQRPDLVILDVQLPDQSGLQVFNSLRARDARIPVIFITGKASTDTAIEAMKLGAYDYLFKPLELAPLRQVVQRALAISRMIQVPAVVAETEAVDDRVDAIIGRCPAMLEVYKAIGRVAEQDVTVLITGETGTGKELVARAIYQHSARSGGPFLALNCAAIAETLLESELFGHEKGAFTGAERKRIGKFEQCNGGTLFLDEVGDMAPLTQTKILRLLQEQTFERLGGEETIHVNVRLLAATNQHLQALMEQGRFRKDLYYRLNGFTIYLPPLRERGDDLTLLVRHYLRRLNRRTGKNVQSVTPETMARLAGHSWPGNVRELQSVLEQAVLHATGSMLLPECLPARLGEETARGEMRGPEADGEGLLRQFVAERLSAGSENVYAEALQWHERQLLTQVLEHTGGNQRQAARVLGITRGSLRNKLRELGISIRRTIDDDAGESDH
jgi:two-component system nitrogen regulation response regulator GlnG